MASDSLKSWLSTEKEAAILISIKNNIGFDLMGEFLTKRYKAFVPEPDSASFYCPYIPIIITKVVASSRKLNTKWGV